jgi:hypothetical protein
MSEIFTIVILFGMAISFGYLYGVYSHKKKLASVKLPDVLELDRFVHSFMSQVTLLEEASLNYFMTLNDAGLNLLAAIKLELIIALHDIDDLIEKKQIDDANALIAFINNPEGELSPHVLNLSKARLTKLKGWRQPAREKILDCIIELGIMSNQPEFSLRQKIPVGSGDEIEQRRKTFCTLDRLRELIVDDDDEGFNTSEAELQ